MFVAPDDGDVADAEFDDGEIIEAGLDDGAL
jgi:hypothetical protein